MTIDQTGRQSVLRYVSDSGGSVEISATPEWCTIAVNGQTFTLLAEDQALRGERAATALGGALDAWAADVRSERLAGARAHADEHEAFELRRAARIEGWAAQ